jgi:lipoprotein-anchoring transpeptidase ErfK/SrfK
MKRSSIRKAAALLAVLNAITISSCINKSDTKEVKVQDNIVIEEQYEKPKEDFQDHLEEVYNLPVTQKWIDVNAYHYLVKNAYLFEDESFNKPGTLIEQYQKVYVKQVSHDWAYVQTDDGEFGYMEPYLLFKLPDDIFVDVDISDQLTRVYELQELVYSTPCVTGKDSTPTDLGYFDIDDKQEQTYLTAFNDDGTLDYSTFVNYWMPYNFGEGMHDALWQVGHFGDTSYYHDGGSHGCDGLPLESAQKIYEKVKVGTKVIVHSQKTNNRITQIQNHNYQNHNYNVKKLVRERRHF